MTYESTSGSTIAFIDGVKFGAVWGPAVDDQEVWFAATIHDEPQRIRTREEAERFLSQAVRAAMGGELP